MINNVIPMRRRTDKVFVPAIVREPTFAFNIKKEEPMKKPGFWFYVLEFFKGFLFGWLFGGLFGMIFGGGGLFVIPIFMNQKKDDNGPSRTDQRQDNRD